ncbi:MAG: hypothetical protein JXB13_02755 [Phycisphaerae bacterium]|nr:hypothetical protein [Phycisphaerae bacterium]
MEFLTLWRDRADNAQRMERPWVTAALCLVLLLAGCAGSRKYQPPVDTQTLDATLFVHYLATAPAVTIDEAARAVLILADGEETTDTAARAAPATQGTKGRRDEGTEEDVSSAEARLAELERRGWIRPIWGLQPEHTLDRATLGYLLFRACKLPDSVNTIMLGSWGAGDRRYAMRQAVALGLMEHGPEYEPVTGGEFVAALTRADEYLHGGGEE